MRRQPDQHRLVMQSRQCRLWAVTWTSSTFKPTPQVPVMIRNKPFRHIAATMRSVPFLFSLHSSTLATCAVGLGVTCHGKLLLEGLFVQPSGTCTSVPVHQVRNSAYGRVAIDANAKEGLAAHKATSAQGDHATSVVVVCRLLSSCTDPEHTTFKSGCLGFWAWVLGLGPRSGSCR